MSLRSVRSARVTPGQRVLVTAELNVARDGRGRVVDDTRLRAILPTLNWLIRKRAKVVIATHLGRPNGRRVASLSTQSLTEPLGRALGRQVAWVDDCIGPKVTAAVSELRPGQILLLENTRFYPGEEKNSSRFSRALAGDADLFVLESFGTAHRRHASIVGVAHYLPAFAGLRLVEEITRLQRVLRHPRRPFIVLLGGAKISSKLGLIARLLPRVDALLLGGALANTILQAQGIQIGTSLTEPEMLRRVRNLKLTNPKLHIPVDVVVQTRGGRPRVRAVGAVSRGESIFDIGPDTRQLFSRIVMTARTIVWNGPMGLYERPPFHVGTKAVARALARSSAESIVGGGETVDALRSQHLEPRVDFVSTGGGAMLEFLEGKTLPGIAALQHSRRRL